MSDKQVSFFDQSDEDLAAALQHGEIKAFDAIVHRYKDPLVNFVYRYLGDYDESNDIVQDAFVRVYQNIDKYKPIAKFSTWIYTIAINLARTRYSQRKKWGIFAFVRRQDEDEEREVEIIDNDLLPDESAEQSLQHEFIEVALNKLPMKYKEIIILFEIEEKSYEEICEITGINIGTVKSRLNRARSKLQELLKGIV